MPRIKEGILFPWSMARKKQYRSKMKKIEPAVQTFLVKTASTTAPGVAGSTTSFVDISQIACLLNRRFYRQGINWAVSGMKIFSGASGNITISKLPETWVMSNAWEKGFRSWQRMNNDALAESESVRPRFLDFKIFADDAHHSAGFGANLLPYSPLTLVDIHPGEWESSKMIVPKTNGTDQVSSFEIIATGANYPGAGFSGQNAVSLIEGYANSRSLPQVLDPNTPDDARDASGTNPENWIVALSNEGTQQDEVILADMTLENNIAPYPFENDGVNVDTMYPNGELQFSGLQFHDFETVTGTTIGGITRIKGGMFPCGLMRIDHQTSESNGNLVIQIDLVPGNHRGYLCEPMTEM